MWSCRNDPLATAVAAAAALVAFGVWLATNHAALDVREDVSDTVFVVAPLIAAVSCWSAARRDDAWRRGWSWIGAGCFTWSLGSMMYACYELVLGVKAPFPSVADAPYILFAVPIVVGLLRFPRAQRGLLPTMRLAVDTLVIVVTLVFAASIVLLKPVLSEPGLSLLARLDALCYPLADVSIAAVVLARCSVFSSTRRLGWIVLSAGLLIQSLTDSIYVAKTVDGGYLPGHLLDLGWAASFLTVAIAARIPVETSHSAAPEAAAPPSLLQQLLPYAPIALAVGALMQEQAAPFRGHSPYVWATVAVGVVIAARQSIVVADHVSLTRDLAREVQRRTGELASREQWWRELVRNLSDVIIVLDPAGTVVYCSPSVVNALGAWPRHLTTGRSLRQLLHPDDLPAVLEHITPVVDGRHRHGFVECRIRREDGTWGWFEVTAVGQLVESALEGAVLTLHDITERRRLTDELSHQAFHDALTGLPNRALLMQRIQRALANQGSGRLALLLIDLDDFKFINDTHGHQAGDAVLREIGKRLQQSVRGGDTIARLGGDEFAVLLHNAGDQVDFAARRLVEAVERPVVTDGRRFVVHASVGIVFADDCRDETPQSMLAHADIALYEAKAHDKGGIVVIEGAERAAAAQQVHLRQEIAQPVLDDFYVVFQPLVDLATGELRGTEALLRWDHPQLGQISPADFIPLAEHGGSITTLGWFVLDSACRALAEWREIAPQHRLAAGVNVSILQLHEPGFVTGVLSFIEEYALAPDQLVLEITEQSLARDFETAVGVVGELRQAGVSVAVDDFGTGYSSLRYLHRFAADVVKIDRSFVANLSESDHTRKLVRSVVEMARSLDLQSVAEGIETPEQLAIVRALGCEIGQGFLFSRPVAVERITEMLAAGPLYPMAGVPSQRSATPV